MKGEKQHYKILIIFSDNYVMLLNNRVIQTIQADILEWNLFIFLNIIPTPKPSKLYPP